MKLIFYKKKLNLKNSIFFLINYLKIKNFLFFTKKNFRYYYLGFNLTSLKIYNDSYKINKNQKQNLSNDLLERFCSFKKKLEIFGCFCYEYSDCFYKKKYETLFKKPRNRIIFDKKKKEIIVSFLDKKKKYKKNIKKIKFIFNILNEHKNKSIFIFKINNRIFFNTIKYFKNFEKLKNEIKIGNLMQIQMSKKITLNFNKNIKTKLKNYIFNEIKKNIFNYLYFFNYGKNSIIGNSPETLVNKRINILTLKPIAGSIIRGINIFMDKMLEKKMLSDKKEICEHNMLIDLCRNDINKTSISPKLYLNVKKIEKYSYVQHIVSTIISKQNKKTSFLKLIKKLIPSGTLSGSPKYKATKIIEKIEKNKRGFYGGALGCFLNNKNYDFSILIRTVLIENKKISTQVASGIVKNSEKKNELKELYNKANSIIKIFSK